jgi:hypothetical protein
VGDCGEPFETKDLDLMMKLSLTPGGLVDVAPVFRHFVAPDARRCFSGLPHAEGRHPREEAEITVVMQDGEPVAQGARGDQAIH